MRFLDTTLGDALDAQALRYGNAPLVVFNGDEASYQHVQATADAVARSLVDIGVKRGDNVAIWMPNRLEWVYTLFAAAKIGARLVPLNTRFKTQELQYALAQSETSTLVIVDRFLSIDFVGMVHQVCPELAQSRLGTLESSQFPSLKSVICVSEESYDGMYRFNELLDRGRHTKTDITHIQRSVMPNDIACIMYTSGTTAFPKGAMLTHGSLLQNAFFVGERWQVDEHDRIFSPFPLVHGAGLTNSLLVAFTHGASLWSMSRWDAEKAMATIQDIKATVYVGPFTTQADMLDHPNLAQYDLSSVKLAQATHHESIGRRLNERLGWGVSGVYGLTESSPNVCVGDTRDPIETRFQKGGKPFTGIDVKIVDPETGQSLPNGTVGRVYVRGWSVMAGYYNKPADTAEAIDADGWLHTGDMGVLDEEGYLTFRGRYKDVIRCGGENVSAEEIEALLLTHPKVHQVQVIGVSHPRKGEVPMAFIEVKPGQACTENDIVEFCSSRVANFKVPAHVRFVTEWPLTHLGKIQKFELRKMVVAQGAEGVKSSFDT